FVSCVRLDQISGHFGTGPQGPDPESRYAYGVYFWIPRSLAALAPGMTTPTRSTANPCSTRQPRLHHAARLGHVHLSGKLAPQHADDLAHVLHAGGAGFLHRRLDRNLHFIV